MVWIWRQITKNRNFECQMAKDKNIKLFTAEDIEKYHSGELSAQERHAIEKAALDDPFLADALEGYSFVNTNTTADLEELQERLNTKVHGARIVKMHSEKDNTKFPWLKAAAILVLIAGGGLLANEFLFNRNKTEIAKVEDTKSPQTNPPVNDTFKASGNLGSTTNSASPDTVYTYRNTITANGQAAKLKLDSNIAVFNEFSLSKSADINEESGKNINPTTITTKDQVTPDKSLAKEETRVKDEDAKLLAESKIAAGKKSEDISYGVNPSTKQPNLAFKVSTEKKEKFLTRDNYFRGRVIDGNNNPVPFANIMNTRDSAGTYADAKGFFNFVSPDTVLDVHVRSIGYEEFNTRLRNNVTNNQVVLLDDKNDVSEIVLNNKRPNVIARANRQDMILEEPEPADGWEKYDTYLANNLKTPEELKIRPDASGEVEVSFEVNKNGEPVNIKVERSLCSSCDEEAIRLIKEGPKWKRKARRERTIVKVAF